MSVPLVLLPDIMCDARLFAVQIMALSVDHAVMVAPVTGDARIEAIAAGLLGKLPVRFALAGIGFGGIVAMDILRQAPDRVERLCLMGTSPLPDTPDMAAAREPLIVRAQAGRLAEVLEEVIGPDWFAPGPARIEFQRYVHQIAMDLGPDIFVRQMRALQRRRDQQATLRRCGAPTLILCGAEDVVTPMRRHSFMAELVPGARLQVIEQAGHLIPVEHPEAMTQVLRDWLNSPSRTL